MEKLPERLTKEFRGIRLFRDNLETIEKIFFDNFSNVNIYVGNIKYDNIAELLQYEKYKINNLIIEGGITNNNGFNKILLLSIKLNGASLTLYDNDNLKFIGIMKIIEDILIQNSWLRGYLFTTEIILSILLSTVIMNFLIKYEKQTSPMATIAILYVAMIFMFIIIIAQIDNYLFFRNTIFLRYKKEFPNFIIRNKDNIIVGLICCIFGSVIGGLLVYFLTNISQTKGK
jgi:hypothetical protein